MLLVFIFMLTFSLFNLCSLLFFLFVFLLLLLLSILILPLLPLLVLNFLFLFFFVQTDELYAQKLKYKAISEELDHALNDMTSM